MNDFTLMEGFPPSEASRVTLANWRKPPFNRWSFKHVREIVPSADIANDPAQVHRLASTPVDLFQLSLEWQGESLGMAEAWRRTGTDSLVVLHRGALVHEHYEADMRPSDPHILMSVSKSVLGLLAGVLVARGDLDPEKPVADWVPEIAGTAYAGATVRNLLDMRAGVLFDEDYLATGGTIIAYRKAQGWEPLAPGDEPAHLRGFYRHMREADGSHGGRFHYVSPNTDLLGWVFERATGRRYADLVSEHIWRPMGAERDAYITVDRLGAPRCAGGMCCTARDLARIGLLVAGGGAIGGRQVVPAAWVDDIVGSGDRDAWDKGDFADHFPGLPVHYRSKWYVLHGQTPLIFAVGVYGQHIFIDQANDIVIAKFSSHPLPTDNDRTALTMRAVAAIRRHLAG